MTRPPRDLGASAFDRLKAHARVPGQDFNLNSRMKDIFDLQALAARLAFDGLRLCEAIRETFKRRGLAIGDGLPAALTAAFADDELLRTRWDAFLRRNRLDGAGRSAAVDEVRRFVGEPWAALAHGTPFTSHWPPGGPWQTRAVS